MPAITAKDVKDLRARTNLPMMECKKALQETDGDQDAAVEWLRKRGIDVGTKRADRETAFGRFGVYPADAGGDSSLASPGAMVELKCESAPVAGNDEFIQLANDLAQQLATGPGVSTADELLDQDSPSKPGTTLREQKDDLFNRIREVFNVGRLVKYDGNCAAYSHNATTVAGVLLEVEGDDAEAAKGICHHIAAMSPKALTTEELDPAVVAKEKEILTEAARAEGKPDNIIEKMVEGRLRSFYAESVLSEQVYVKAPEDAPKITVAKYAERCGLKLKGFTHWVLGQE